MSDDLVVVMCPPLSSYVKKPDDHSHSEIFDCPICKEKMWLSDKKKGLLLFASCLKKDILLGCYDCIKNDMEENINMYKNIETLNL